MKTFEGRGRVEDIPGRDNQTVIFLMYLTRAISATFILSLLLYILVTRILSFLYPIPTFPEFVFGNILAELGILGLILVFQLLFYFYRMKAGRLPRRSFWDLVIGYLIPVLGMVAALYTAYAIGVM